VRRPVPVQPLAVVRFTGSGNARQALLIGRYTTHKKKGRRHTHCEAVLYITSLDAEDATPGDLLAHVRGHWRIEHAHWQHDVIWKEDRALVRTGNATLTNPWSSHGPLQSVNGQP
jgi:hypothetical protein